MKRYLATLAVLAWLALPVMVGAEETWIPPEANWTSTPPARGAVDAAQLKEISVKKAVITPQEAAQLTQPQAATPTGQRREAAREPSTSYLTTP